MSVARMQEIALRISDETGVRVQVVIDGDGRNFKVDGSGQLFRTIQHARKHAILIGVSRGTLVQVV